MARKYANGLFTPKYPEKYLGKGSIKYRSGWEFQFMKMCDEHPAILQWASESIRIPYRNPLTGKQTIYVPDFFVVFSDKTGKQNVELIEVKPSNQTHKEKVGKSQYNQAQWVVNQAKWEAARNWCKQQGIKFRIVTENELYHNGKRR